MLRIEIKVLFTVFAVFLAFSSESQDEKIPYDILNRINKTIKLFKADSISELALLVNYPLRRENPLPDITSKEEFISNFSNLFDSIFIRKLINCTDSDIFRVRGDYGVFAGEIWFDENGNIIGINYISPSERKLKEKLVHEVFGRMYHGIKPWKENYLVCKSNNFIIRVDDTEDGLRYISWGKGKQISDKPDLVLYHGHEEFQGTEGGVTYTFKNGRWAYVLDDVWESEEVKETGLYLRLLYMGVEKKSYKCEETK
jgi:hypothetical protein